MVMKTSTNQSAPDFCNFIYEYKLIEYKNILTLINQNYAYN